MDDLQKSDEVVPEPNEELRQVPSECYGESESSVTVTRKKHCGEGDNIQSSKNLNFDQISEGSLEVEGECVKRLSLENEKVDDTGEQHSLIQEDVISEDIDFEDFQDVQEKENPAIQKESDSRSKSVEMFSEDEEEEEEFHDIEDPELANLEENDNDSQVEVKEVDKSAEQNVTEDPNQSSSNSDKDQSSAIFEEVDSSITDGDKSSNTQDLDILFDDRTQVIENCDKDNPNNLSNSSVQKEVNLQDNAETVNLPSKISKENEENQVQVMNNESEELSKKKDEEDSQGKNEFQTSNDNDDNMNVNDFEESQTSDQQQEDMGEIIIASDNDMEEPSVGQQSEETSELIDESHNAQSLLEYDDTIEENIEHVLEPEESDICLIPDREKEVTDAEREQAILVRENAEKEDNREFQDNINQSNEEEVRTNLEQANDETHLDNQETLSDQSNKIIISTTVGIQENCIKCNTLKYCGFRYKNPESGQYEFVCDKSCIDAVQNDNQGKYVVRRKKFLVEEVGEATTQKCLKCIKEIQCKYFFKYEDISYYICNDDCFNSLTAEEPDKFKLKRHSIRVRNIGATISGTKKDKTNESESTIVARSASEAEAARLDRAASFLRRCAKCSQEIIKIDNAIHWQTMDFCNEQCLEQYQQSVGSSCKTCNADVSAACISKYCVRFGNELQQFCSVSCLTEFKKSLKTCSCCQKDISGNGEGFLASVGDKEQFKDFCSQACMRHYDIICNPKKKLRVHQCAVCNNEKPVRVEILIDKKEHYFCSNPCFSAFKFVSNVVSDQCGMCSKYFERKSNECFTIYTDKRPKVFCCRICLNVFIIVNRKIVSCQWCKVKKYNFDMISKYTNNQNILMCSLNCLTLYGVSVNANSLSIIKCDNCNNTETSQYHLTMSDSSLRNFCTYQCVMQFQSKFNRKPLTKPDDYKEQKTTKQTTLPYPTGLPKRVKLKKVDQLKPLQTPVLPIISTVSSLASGESETMIGSVTVRRSNANRGRGKNTKMKYIEQEPTPAPSISSNTNDLSKTTTAIGTKPVIAKKKPITLSTSNDNLKIDNETKTKIITVPPLPPKMRNIMTQCRPIMVSKETNCKPIMVDTEMQTDDDHSSKILIPVPIPIYVPQPMYMYSAPFPCPIPIPLPIPVPIFIPTTRNSANGIMKEIKKIQDKMPADPFEAELLMMAEMVADEKHDSDSDSDEETKAEPSEVPYTNNVNIEHNQSYGDDVLQMALKMASGDYEEPISVDLESAMRTNTISNPPPGIVEQEDANDLGHQIIMMDGQQSTRGRGRKRSPGSSPGTARNNSRTPIKRVRRDTPITQTHETTSHTLQPTEKPDVNMCLKYTFGVNAWKQWVVTKNIDLEKSSIRRRPFKTELLQMTADELNYSLCLFVKEVRKPNGSEYAPDTIYYLVLGIQQYLYENGRIDNIFTDPYYERFTDCLDEAAQKFSVLYNDSQFIVTRVEEEHLWECKQLGAHSPHVLLSTLMFFNTKHFNLTTVDEHMQLSFSHIMKHWKRTAQNTKSPGARNVLLRFYPPQAGLDANPRKKKVYEQQENEENPLRCPVRLYEFYLSKCPESVKTRNDVFYLQPERSCVPDSPVWYSTQPLSQEALQKMLHRVKMVKEINIALLTS